MFMDYSRSNDFAEDYLPTDKGFFTHEENFTWSQMRARAYELYAANRDMIHPAFWEGLARLNFPVDRLPTIDMLNQALASLRWSVIYVDGYIPAKKYAELIASRIFPISRSIRKYSQLDYSPAPDMVHDLIGHLPILFWEEHREYLRLVASALAIAESSQYDDDLYSANRKLSLTLAADDPDPAAVQAARSDIQAAEAALQRSPSELHKLSHLFLWSAEFGLLGGRQDPIVIGAGLLSSPKEFLRIATREFVALPYDLGATNFDILFSELQPSYFVASHHQRYFEVLAECIGKMSTFNSRSLAAGAMPVT